MPQEAWMLDKHLCSAIPQNPVGTQKTIKQEHRYPSSHPEGILQLRFKKGFNTGDISE